MLIEEAIYLFDESNSIKKIKSNKLNLLWVSKFKGYRKIINNSIINSGFIIGSRKYFILFLKQFCKFIGMTNVATTEQGWLNYTFYSGYFNNIKFLRHKNQMGVILTTGIDLLEAKKLKIINSAIFNKDNSNPLVVHQYDRYSKFTFI